MKKTVKKILSLLLVIATTTVSTKVVNAEPSTDLGVTVEATIIDVTITPSITISINPNTGAVTKTDISVVNNSKAPISLSSTGLTTTGDSKLTLVSPSKYSDWSVLNKTESKDLALTLTTTSGWKAMTNNNLTTGVTGTLDATLNPSSTGIVIISDILHGNSFESTISSAYKISWLITLE